MDEDPGADILSSDIHQIAPHIPNRSEKRPAKADLDSQRSVQKSAKSKI